MKRTGLPTIAWALVGLLLIAAGLISLGQQDQQAKPEAKSFGPSGVSAFAELLRRSGVEVSINQVSKPKLGPNDVAVAFEIVNTDPNAFMTASDGESPQDRFNDNFWSFIKGGGSGIVLPLKKDYVDASNSAKENPFETVKDESTGRSFRVTSTGISQDDAFDSASGKDDSVQMALWDDKDGSFLNAYRVGKGTAIVARDGIGITNRFIDKYDNAQAFMSLFSILVKAHKRVVFTEASFGNVHDPGLLETVGPWAIAAWQQLIVLGLVVVFTLGKPFGVPEEPRSAQRGSRELLDAVADTFRRARATQAALGTAYSAADAELRLILKLPKDATRNERDRLIPVGLQNALARLEVASEFPVVTQEHALDLIVRAQAELDDFIGPNRAKLRSLAKLRT